MLQWCIFLQRKTFLVRLLNGTRISSLLPAVSSAEDEDAGHFVSPVMRRDNNLKWRGGGGAWVKDGSKISPSSYNAPFVVTAD